MTDIEKVKAMVDASYIYIPYDSEALRINYADHDVGMFYTTGEESGDDIAISFEDVDLERDMFYRLKLVDINVIE